MLVQRLPPVRDQQVVPGGEPVESVAGPLVGAGSARRAVPRRRRLGLGHLVEGSSDAVQRGVLLGRDGRDGGRAAELEGPGAARRVHGAAARRDDDVAALAASLDEDLRHPLGRESGDLDEPLIEELLVVRVLLLGALNLAGLVVEQLVGRRRASSELGVPGHRRALHSIPQVHAAAGAGLAVARGDPLPQVAQADGEGQVAVLVVQPLRDGPTLELEELQVPGHGAGDDADTGVPTSEPAGDGAERRRLHLRVLPLPGGCLRAVDSDADDGAPGLGERHGCQRGGPGGRRLQQRHQVHRPARGRERRRAGRVRGRS